MLEQEIASIIKYTLEKAGSPPPYYNEVPEGFLLPSVYFPVPEVTSSGNTFTTYSLNYTWFIKVFHVDKVSAFGLALAVMTAIRGDRNLIPLIDTEGAPTGEGFRVKDPSLRVLDTSPAIAQLTLTWDSARPYDDPEAQKMMAYNLDVYTKSAYAQAVEQARGKP